MIRLAILLPLAFLPGISSAAEECPAFLALKVPKLSTQDHRSAQQYATCVSEPRLPTASELNGKRSECRKNQPAKAIVTLTAAVKWVDHIATEFPGCETRLEIKKK